MNDNLGFIFYLTLYMMPAGAIAFVLVRDVLLKEDEES